MLNAYMITLTTNLSEMFRLCDIFLDKSLILLRQLIQALKSKGIRIVISQVTSFNIQNNDAIVCNLFIFNFTLYYKSN